MIFLLTYRARILVLIAMSAIAVFVFLSPTDSHSLAQDADDAFQNTDPCKDGNNPGHFVIYPPGGPPGSFIFIQGKPHDPKTVGPGSGVGFNWQDDPNYTYYGAQVNPQGTFMAMVQIPPYLAPGEHMLVYAEASPYTSCLEINVTQPGAESTDPRTIPGLDLFIMVLDTLRSLLGAL